MRRHFLLIAALTCLNFAAPIAAQNAFRCDVNGQTVYSDKPCAPGNTGKAVAPTQDTPEQKAASKAANDQMRKDGADLNKRLSEREKLEAAERAAARKAAANARTEAKVAAKGRSGAAKAKTVKQKKAAKSKKKSRPANNSVSSTS
jgi:hypothetical protein